ncbi:MAG: Bro-N domain-containing protein [Lysobacteraceae bacterium]
MTRTTRPATVTFARAELAVIYHDGQPHLSARDLALALGYKDTSAVTRIHSRHAGEFTDAMTLTVKMTARGQVAPTPVRIFSPRGCHLVAMFANTPLAATFRRWVLDVLEGLVQPAPPALPAPEPRVLIPATLPAFDVDEAQRRLTSAWATAMLVGRELLNVQGQRPEAIHFLVTCERDKAPVVRAMTEAT